MKKIFLAIFVLGGLSLVGCKKPETIPAPANKANLKINFQGIINGSDVEWTKNVNKYAANSEKLIYNDVTPGFLDLAYSCAMQSSLKVSSIRINLGSLLQDPDLGTSPNMTTFRTFMDNNLMPNYSDSALAGFEVVYINEDGDLFRSDETSPGTIEFMDLEEKEDNAGEYIQFKAKFSCVVKNWGPTVTTPVTDSVYATAAIQNATMIGYYTR